MSRVFQKRILATQVRRDRRVVGDVDLSPHRAEDCPRWPSEAGVDAPDEPCPFVSCRHHLFGDVTPDGSLRIYHPALDVDQLPDTCTIDVALRGTHSYDVIGYHLGITARQARDDCEGALAKAGPALAAGLALAERERPGCTDDLELRRRRAPTPFDPRTDEPDDMDRARPAGYVPLGETEVEVVGQHREIGRLTEEHLMRQYRLLRLAERLYLMLIANPAWRRCGLSDLTSAYQKASGNATKADKIQAALLDLERAGLVQCDWRACGKVRRLRGVSLVSSLRSAEKYPAGVDSHDCEEVATGLLRASDGRGMVEAED